jgi:CubicO group peptidase (beta-lactamase class C family)
VTGADPREDLFRLLEDAVDQGVFPGCVAIVARAGAVLYHEAHGTLASQPSVPFAGHFVARETIYDLASLTKILCTTTLAAIGVSEKWLELNAEVPPPWRASCPGATMADLLAHCSGLPAHREYFLEVAPLDAEDVLEHVAAASPEYPLRERAVYSDLGFMILGAWIERAADRSLDELFEDRIACTLGLDDPVLPQLGFRRIVPGAVLARRIARRIAPTEVYDAKLHRDGVPSHLEVRQEVPFAHGEVHDDNAYVMGGVAGHAGLFGNAWGVLEVGRAWLENIVPGLNSEVRDLFWRASDVPGSTRRLGFDGPDPEGGGSAGKVLSRAAVGHTGFTGTSLWIDPHPVEGGRIFVLLSNAVHPVRNPEAIKAFRPRFHEAAARL